MVDLDIVMKDTEELTPQKLGFQLEENIHLTFDSYGILCLREKEVNQKYGCKGIDHLFDYCGKRIFLQDKWENKTPNIRDIGYFHSCIDSIEKFYKVPSLYLFVSKKSPSKKGFEMINDHNLISVYSDQMDDLINKLKVKILPFLGIDDRKINELQIKQNEIINLENLMQKDCDNIIRILSSWKNLKNPTNILVMNMINTLTFHRDGNRMPELKPNDIYNEFLKIVKNYNPTQQIFDTANLFVCYLNQMISKGIEINHLNAKNEYKWKHVAFINPKLIQRSEYFANTNQYGFGLSSEYIEKNWKKLLDLTESQMQTLCYTILPNLQYYPINMTTSPQKLVNDFTKINQSSTILPTLIPISNSDSNSI